MRNAQIILVEKPNGKRLLEGSRRRWKNNTEINLTEAILQGVDWIYLYQGKTGRRLLNTPLNTAVR
jgi:hypothetical protein